VFDAHFFFALNLHDLRIMDNDFHRPKTQISEGLRNSLFDGVDNGAFHDDLPFLSVRPAFCELSLPHQPIPSIPVGIVVLIVIN